jgi:hypothetical protein
MTFADITLAVFTFRNSVRFVVYIPQIAKAVRDQSGAEAVALGTWGPSLSGRLAGSDSSALRSSF